MADDRFLRFGSEYKKDSIYQIARVAGFPPLLWRRLAAATSGTCEWIEVRAWCQEAVAVSAAYMEREVFMILTVEPFSLCQGDIAANLAALRGRSLGDVVDETSLNIRRLQEMGFEESVLRGGLELLRDAACSVNVVEQAHGSAATIARCHAYSEDTLLHRAGLHKLRAMFFPGQESRAINLLRGKIRKLDARCLDRVTGRHMCMQELAKETQRNLVGHREGLVPAMRTVMRQHVQHHAALELGQQRVFQERARFF